MLGRALPPPNAAFLESAWSAVADAAHRAQVMVVLGTERLVAGNLVASAIVINSDGTIAGFQDKVQIDPSEERTYTPGTERRVFGTDAITFGVVICHEGWRYPETVRWAARRGAQVVFPSAVPRGGRRFLSTEGLRRPGEHVPRKGPAVSCGREHLLLRDRELCQRGFPHDFSDRQSRRDPACLPALRERGSPGRRHRPQQGDRSACQAVQAHILMRSMVNTIGVLGIIFLNLIFLSIRLFARNQGLKVRWWSRSYASERETPSYAGGVRRCHSGAARATLLATRDSRLDPVCPVVGMFLWGL